MNDAIPVIAATLGIILYTICVAAWFAVLPTIGLLWSIGWLR